MLEKPGKGFKKKGVVSHLKGCREVKLRAQERLWDLPVSPSVVAFSTAVSVELWRERSHCNDLEWIGSEEGDEMKCVLLLREDWL